jgi:hypothetical protein
MTQQKSSKVIAESRKSPSLSTNLLTFQFVRSDSSDDFLSNTKKCLMPFQTKPTTQRNNKNPRKAPQLDLCVCFKQPSQLALIITIFIKLPKNCVESLNKKNGLVRQTAVCARSTVKKANKWILNKLTPDGEKIEWELVKQIVKHRQWIRL